MGHGRTTCKESTVPSLDTTVLFRSGEGLPSVLQYWLTRVANCMVDDIILQLVEALREREPASLAVAPRDRADHWRASRFFVLLPWLPCPPCTSTVSAINPISSYMLLLSYWPGTPYSPYPSLGAQANLG